MHFFMDFIERRIENAMQPVDLCDLAHELVGNTPKKSPNNRLRVVIDADSCLDRLYGGFNSNWLCGSDWIKVHGFYRNLVKACFRHNIELILYFNGTNPKDLEINEWLLKEKYKTDKISTIFDNLNHDKESPNRLWIKPINLIKQIIIQLNTDKINKCHKLVHTFTSVKYHQKEILEFIKINNCDCLLTNDHEFLTIIIAQNIEHIRIFSAKSFKLTMKGRISASEYNLNAIMNTLGITPEQLPLLVTLLGNRFVSERWFNKFYEKIQFSFEEETKPYQDYDYKGRILIGMVTFFTSVSKDLSILINMIENNLIVSDEKETNNRIENLGKSLDYYIKKIPIDWVVNLNEEYNNKEMKASESAHEMTTLKSSTDNYDEGSCDRSTLSSPSNRLSESFTFSSNISNYNNENKKNSPEKPKFITDHICEDPIKRSSVETTIMNLKQLHVRSFISKSLYLAYVERRIYLSSSLEQEGKSLIKSNDLYRPIRRYAYSLLKSSVIRNNETIYVEEIIYNPKTADKEVIRINVESLEHKYENFNLDQMWCSKCTSRDRRINLLIDCLGICKSKDELFYKYGSAYEKKYFVPCAVLRYMLKYGHIITYNDIKAFLCTFVSDYLTNENDPYISNLSLEYINPRAIHLSSLFMSGVDNVSFANDVCGSPFSLHNFNMFYFFNGKLFQHIYQKAAKCISMIELCDEQLEKVTLVDKLYSVVTEDLEHLIEDPPKMELTSICRSISPVMGENIRSRQASNLKIMSRGRGRIFDGTSIKSINPPVEAREVGDLIRHDSRLHQRTRERSASNKHQNVSAANLNTENTYYKNTSTESKATKLVDLSSNNVQISNIDKNNNETKVDASAATGPKKYSAEDLYILSLFNIYPDKEEEKRKKEESNPEKKRKPIRYKQFKPYTWDDLIQLYKSVPHPPRDIITVDYACTKKEKEEQLERMIQEAIEEAKLCDD